jgi:hypothetical protein
VPPALLLAGLALASPAAATPVRTCPQRAELGHPVEFAGAAGAVRLGSGILFNVGSAPRITTAQLKRVDGRDPFFKMGMAVKADTAVVLTIAPESRRYARVAYARLSPDPIRMADWPVSTVIQACPRDQPAFSYAGVVGEATLFPGGFVTDGKGVPRCVGIELRERGKQRTYARTVPFGAIRC